jgi:AraC-like DNA-binding protein
LIRQTSSPAESDVLSEVLAQVRLSARVFCKWDVGAPWGFEVPGARDVAFHFVEKGVVRVRVEGLPEWATLREGEFGLVLRRTPHAIADAPGTALTPIDEIIPNGGQRHRVPVVKWGGGGAPSVLFCGVFEPENEIAHALIAAMPPFVHVSAETARAIPWFRETLAFIADEVASNRPGNEPVLGRLSDVLFVQVLRAWLASEPRGVGWLNALRDGQISQAIGKIHGAPQRQWTIASLARAVGMSRSAFSARFAELVGAPPMAYLTKVRMQLAANRLATSSEGLAQVAGKVGYGSMVAFHRAFKREMGIAPGAYRQGRGLG